MNYSTLSDLMQELGLVFIKEQLIDGVLYIYCATNTEVKCCKRCGSTSFIKHGKYVRKVRFLKILDYNTILVFDQKRFKYKDCKKTFNEEVTFVTEYSTIATAVKVKVISDNSNNKTYTQIAKENNISIGTSFNHFKYHSSDSRNKLTTVLLFDEINYGKDKYAFVIVDGITSKLIDILPCRTQEKLYNYFNQIPVEERKNVKYICTDLYPPYKTILPGFFPNAKPITDRFHYVKLVKDAFDKTRISIMNKYIALASDKSNPKREEHSLYSKLLKKYFKLLTINRYTSKVDFDFTFKVNYLKKEMSNQDIIEYLINYDTTLYDAYDLLNDFYKTINTSTYDDISDNLDIWFKKVEKKKNLVYFAKQIGTFISWRVQIRNSFIVLKETGKRVTNGKIEGKNSNIRRALENSAGIKDFDTFRKKMLSIDNKNSSYKG